MQLRTGPAVEEYSRKFPRLGTQSSFALVGRAEAIPLVIIITIIIIFLLLLLLFLSFIVTSSLIASNHSKIIIRFCLYLSHFVHINCAWFYGIHKRAENSTILETTKYATKHTFVLVVLIAIMQSVRYANRSVSLGMSSVHVYLIVYESVCKRCACVYVRVCLCVNGCVCGVRGVNVWCA